MLRARGPLTIAPANPRLVLAHYYPRDHRSTWNDPQMLDQPARLYSSDDAADVARQVDQAKLAGLDGLVLSWQGKDFGGGWNHRRTLLVEQAARKAGLRLSTLLETTVANPQHEQSGVADRFPLRFSRGSPTSSILYSSDPG